MQKKCRGGLWWRRWDLVIVLRTVMTQGGGNGDWLLVVGYECGLEGGKFSSKIREGMLEKLMAM